MLRMSCLLCHGPSKRVAKVPHALKRQLREMPDFIAVATPGKRPIAFASASPEPVAEARDRDRVDLARDDEGVGAVAIQRWHNNSPIALIDAERMGLPSNMMDTLRGRGITSLTPLQSKLLTHAYALQDIAVSGPTGSGKSFGLCLAIIARLLRQGPMHQASVIVLTPTDVLAAQIAQWLRELWRFPRDERLVFHAALDEGDDVVTRALDDMSPSAPYIVVGTAAKIWQVYTKILDKKMNGHRTVNVRKLKVVPSLEALFVDEVDAVLPPGEPHAPGNLLLTDLQCRNAFHAPLHTVLTSATLSPTIANHVNHFMQRAVMGQFASRLFQDETTDASDTAGAHRATRRFLVADSIEHKFYVAMSYEEQASAFSDALRQWALQRHQRLVGHDDGRAMDESEIVAEHVRDARCVVIIGDNASEETLRDRVLNCVTPIPVRLVSSWTSSMAVPGNQPTFKNDANGPQCVLLRASAVRGLDIVGTTHVIMCLKPSSAKEYLHWSGRAGRMGVEGTAVTMLRKSEVRPMSDFAEHLEIPFKIERRAFTDINVKEWAANNNDAL